MSSVTTVENFHGVYLLYCENPKYLGRTYIGYTVDPNRRIKQHNKGARFGGAWRTSNRGPWEMCLIIHGFPNDISGLRFEWAWQHPQKSRRLRDIKKKQSNENGFQFSIRILSHMLRIGPWNRLALTIQWLNPKYAVNFEPSLLPPHHMPIEYGKVISKRVTPSFEDGNTASTSGHSKNCDICRKELVASETLRCLDSNCPLQAHILCLARHYLQSDPSHMLPLEGSCPLCHQEYLWADLIRKLKGCYQQESFTLDGTVIS